MKVGAALLIAARSIVGRRTSGVAPRGRRYLRGAVIGVALSLVPLVVVLIVADGMIEGITARYLEIGTYHLQATPFTVNGASSLESQAALLRALPGVEAAFAERQGPAVAISGSRSAGAAIRAIDPLFLRDSGTIKYLSLVSGSMELTSGSDTLLGEALARNLGAGVGDSITLVTARKAYGESGKKAELAPRISIFKVRGIVTAGYRELDALWAFVPLKAAARILSPEVSHSFVGIKVRDPFGDLEAAKDAVGMSLPPEWSVETWSELERNLFKSFSTTRALLLLVMALTVAVAAINVASALIMLVLERRRDIAVLKSSGTQESFIGAVFVLAGLVTGGAGTVLGIAVGCLVAWRINDFIAAVEFALNATSRFVNIVSGIAPSSQGFKLLDPSYYLERIPVRISLVEMSMVAVSSILLCLLASLLPARRAASLSPMEIMRKT